MTPLAATISHASVLFICKLFANITLSIKPEVGLHHILTTPPEEARATAIRNMRKNFAKIGRVVAEICSQTDKL